MTTSLSILDSAEILNKGGHQYKDVECVCEFVNTFATPDPFCDSLVFGFRNMK
jgi:hypothetical protein